MTDPAPHSEPFRVIVDVDTEASRIVVVDCVGVTAAWRYAEIVTKAETSRYWQRRKRWIDRRGGLRDDYVAIRGLYDRVAP